MNFEKAVPVVVGALGAAGVRYALIGGFAMAVRGVQRATMDLDFILLLEDLAKTDVILQGLGFQRAFHSENVSHYASADQEWGRIDFLHAFRAPSLGMLKRAELIEIYAGVHLPVAQMEDIIGLKVQASVNDPSRAIADWDDIRLLLQAARLRPEPPDWELLADYLRLFQLEQKLSLMKEIYGATD